MMRRVFIFVLLAVFMSAGLWTGCGADMTVEDVHPILTLPRLNSAATLSGAGIATDGEHYKLMQKIGGPTLLPHQQSEDGRYKVR